MNLQKMTMVEIQKFAKSIGLKGYSKFTKKADLITFVEPFITTEEPKTENPISTQEVSPTELEEENTFGPSETEAFYQSEVSIKDIAFDFKTTDRKIRRILRTNGLTKHPERGWNFERDSQEHKAVLSLLNEKLGGGQ